MREKPFFQWTQTNATTERTYEDVWKFVRLKKIVEMIGNRKIDWLFSFSVFQGTFFLTKPVVSVNPINSLKLLEQMLKCVSFVIVIAIMVNL